MTVALAQVMLELVGLDGDPRRALHDGSALAVWRDMVRSQGGDPTHPLPAAAVVEPVVAERAGFLQRLDARPVGVAAWRLGAGRSRKEDPVSPSAGVRCLVKPGEPVEKGQVLLELHTDDAGSPRAFPGRTAAARSRYGGSRRLECLRGSSSSGWARPGAWPIMSRGRREPEFRLAIFPSVKSRYGAHWVA